MYLQHQRRSRPVYNAASHRLREIERVIASRHGGSLDTDDADVYLVPVAVTLRSICQRKFGRATTEDVLDRLQVWAGGRAPRVANELLIASAREAMHWPKLEKADALAARLKLTYAERMHLRITTIGSCDVDKAERKRRAKIRKRERDRIRAARRRADAGSIPREQSLSRIQPWKAEGISRRTWYRRLGTSLSSSRQIKSAKRRIRARLPPSQ